MKKFYKIWRKGLFFPVLLLLGFATGQIFTMPMEIVVLLIWIVIVVALELCAWKKGWHRE